MHAGLAAGSTNMTDNGVDSGHARALEDRIFKRSFSFHMAPWKRQNTAPDCRPTAFKCLFESSADLPGVDSQPEEHLCGCRLRITLGRQAACTGPANKNSTDFAGHLVTQEGVCCANPQAALCGGVSSTDGRTGARRKFKQIQQERGN